MTEVLLSLVVDRTPIVVLIHNDQTEDEQVNGWKRQQKKKRKKKQTVPSLA